ncbi:Cytochrome P450 [Metarhizium rileyi]|uniref:Cytochrome P450 monooxygenase ppzG n=1 Tax=Metarhizium rileyi (strain RCEF 4871) TaxID=1649241 RepID=PPZG_METRR|nr:RecName: Full=Cytochrome P450 monooxygenase ppzG; AltName: Full=Pyrrolopyrazine biosynthesis cluster protein G [Metarhizium rileyi RCEF 4871]OAA37393.1 Cytochrome P450 [Metarhizium rileyi RCEF 4871]
MNDFVFSDIPDNVKPMASVEFDDPLTIATGDVLNWTLWLTRNFPALSSIIMRLPSSLVSMVTSSFEGANQMVQVKTSTHNLYSLSLPTHARKQIISQLVEHEKNHIGPKSKDCVMQRLLNAHRDSESKISIPTPDATLRSEAVGFTLAGTADPPNILALGTFMAARDSEMQKGLYKELKAIWPDLRSPAPSYNLLHQLPLLRGIIKESIRFTHGVATGPARLVGAGGARIGGYNVPAKASSFSAAATSDCS